jgi:sortase (surface protein transpeptidase)
LVLNPIIHSKQRRRLLVPALLTLAITLFAAAAVTARSGEARAGSQLERQLPAPPRIPDSRTSAVKSAPKEVRSASTAGTPKEMPVPVRILIPAIGVNAGIIPLGLNRDRTIQVPQSAAIAGWFKPGPEPGELGAAVILGHVDSAHGPGVFYRLRALQPGDAITVVVRTGSKVRFVITGMKAVAKERFPKKRIYRHAGEAVLRLVTCDGRFDTRTGHYVDNYVVFARRITQPGDRRTRRISRRAKTRRHPATPTPRVSARPSPRSPEGDRRIARISRRAERESSRATPKVEASPTERAR